MEADPGGLGRWGSKNDLDSFPSQTVRGLRSHLGYSFVTGWRQKYSPASSSENSDSAMDVEGRSFDSQTSLASVDHEYSTVVFLDHGPGDERSDFAGSTFARDMPTEYSSWTPTRRSAERRASRDECGVSGIGENVNRTRWSPSRADPVRARPRMTSESVTKTTPFGNGLPPPVPRWIRMGGEPHQVSGGVVEESFHDRLLPLWGRRESVQGRLHRRGTRLEVLVEQVRLCGEFSKVPIRREIWRSQEGDDGDGDDRDHRCGEQRSLTTRPGSGCLTSHGS